MHDGFTITMPTLGKFHGLWLPYWKRLRREEKIGKATNFISLKKELKNSKIKCYELIISLMFRELNVAHNKF